jgi:hypothetical protein
MDVGAIATLLVGSQTTDIQLAIAGKLLRMNAQAAADAGRIIEAAQQNMATAVTAADGVGGNLDISV